MTRKLIAEIENPDKQDRYIASMEDDDPTRPSIGFSLGLVLLFVVLLSMSGFLTCCLHWDKIRALLGALTHDQENDHLPQKSSPPSLVCTSLGYLFSIYYVYLIKFKVVTMVTTADHPL